MKRIGDIFDRIVDRDNLLLAFLKAGKGKRSRRDWFEYSKELGAEIERLRTGLLKYDYPVGNFRRFTIFDPKEREICAVPFGERVLHHAIMNICGEYFDKWLIYDTYACRKGKGQVAAVERARRFAGARRWYLKSDFRKYFDSVPHDRLKAVLFRKFKDARLLEWFCKIIDSYEKTPGRGLPIGSLTSQHFANLYLDSLDRFATRSGLPYVRYMDDFVLWADAKQTLLDVRREVVDFARNTLGLELKQMPFINRTALGMDFLGKRVFPHSVALSRASRVRYMRKMKACAAEFRRGIIDEAAYQARATALTAFAAGARSAAWRRKVLEVCEEQPAGTASCAAAAGTTTPGTAAPRTATGTTLATATGTTASASLAPQHGFDNQTVPADIRIPAQAGTNPKRRAGASSNAESPGASTSFGKEIKKDYTLIPDFRKRGDGGLAEGRME